MRPPLRIVVTVLLATSALAACAPQISSPAERSAVVEPARPTLLRVALAGDVDHFGLRFQLATGSLENTAGVRDAKRDLARVLTVAHERGIDTDGMR